MDVHLDSWTPPALSSVTTSLEDEVRSAPLDSLRTLWALHKTAVFADAGNTPLLKAFLKCASDLGRRSATLAEPILYEVAAQSLSLDKDDFCMLAASTCDVTSRRVVECLLERTMGEVQYIAFYYSLLRCVTECFRPVDMVLATQITSVMASHGIRMYIPHVRFLIHGFARLREPMLKPVENLVLRCLADAPEVPMDPTVLHELLGICERCGGEYAKHALRILERVGFDHCRKLITSVYTRPPNAEREQERTYTTFYIVDPYTFPVDTTPLPPPLRGRSTRWFIFFLYSAVREMIECNSNFPTGNRMLQGKLDAIRNLILREPNHIFVFPIDIELQFRAAGRDGFAEDNPTSRHVSFMEAVIQQQEVTPSNPPPEEAHLVFVTQNPALKAALEDRMQQSNVPHLSVQTSFIT